MNDIADETLRDIARMVGSNPSDADQQRGLRLAAIRELQRVKDERDSALRKCREHEQTIAALEHDLGIAATTAADLLATDTARSLAERDSAIRLAADQARIMGDLRAQIATLTSQCIEIMTGRRSTVSAEATADAILARAGEDGALHRDAMIDVLRKVGGLA